MNRIKNNGKYDDDTITTDGAAGGRVPHGQREGNAEVANEKAMQKLQRFLNKLKQKEEANAKAEEMTAAEKEEILNDIREGLRELKLAREGKLKPRPIEELLHEL